jgi:hypothetical protein
MVKNPPKVKVDGEGTEDLVAGDRISYRNWRCNERGSGSFLIGFLSEVIPGKQKCQLFPVRRLQEILNLNHFTGEDPQITTILQCGIAV